MKSISYVLLAMILSMVSAKGADHPNILWIVSEDNSSHWIGCYGNEQAKTPRLDAFAREGILFEHAYSNAPVCAVARATILNGMYSPTMGTQHMRSRHPIPQRYRPYVEYLRQAGYYCTNHAKTDYNFKGKDTAIWNESSGKAHYRNRPDGAPFFATFNLGVTHESSLFDNQPAEPKRLTPAEINLPPYVPDLPEMRKDFARYHDRITAMDTQFGQLLDELEKAGLADDTIVIYSSDHGGITPRGKRYLYETGVKIPLLIRVPAKWRQLTPFSPGERVAEPVSFVDFLPTFLSLAGVDIPAYLQGRAFLGPERKKPAPDEMEFLYADRFDEIYGMRRGLTDGRWKYIRCFTPQLPAAPYSLYPYGQPAWRAWHKAWEQGKLTGRFKEIWETNQPPEELYDISKDPWEIHNLATDPNYSGKLLALRERLKRTMREVRDTGLVPEPLFAPLSEGSTIADFVQSSRFDFDRALDLAFAATQQDPAMLPFLADGLSSSSPVDRYWALCGMEIAGAAAKDEVNAVRPLLKDKYSVNRTTAANALWALGRQDLAKPFLIDSVASTDDPVSLLYLLNVLEDHQLMNDLPEGWQKSKLGDKGGTDYINRMYLHSIKEAASGKD